MESVPTMLDVQTRMVRTVARDHADERRREGTGVPVRGVMMAMRRWAYYLSTVLVLCFRSCLGSQVATAQMEEMERDRWSLICHTSICPRMDSSWDFKCVMELMLLPLDECGLMEEYHNGNVDGVHQLLYRPGAMWNSTSGFFPKSSQERSIRLDPLRSTITLVAKGRYS